MRGKTITRTKFPQAPKHSFFRKNETPHLFFESGRPNKFFGGESKIIHRTCDECAKEEQVQRKSIDGAVVTPSKTQGFIDNISSSGQSLPIEQQHFFGRRMSHDFGEVKIHTGKEAAESASALNAQAYTYQNNIVFSENKYQPTTPEGKKLLSHELAHVIQEDNQYVFRQERLEQPAVVNEIRDLLNSGDSTRFISRLRRLTYVEASAVARNDELVAAFQQQFTGNALWSVFSIILTRLLQSHVGDLTTAIFARQAELVLDLITVLQNAELMTNVYRQFIQISMPQVFARHPLLPQMQAVLNGTAAAGRAAGRFSQVHYEENAQGQMELSHIRESFRAAYRITSTEMRVLVTLNFKHPGSFPRRTFYFEGPHLPGVLDGWLAGVRDIWNNKFVLENGAVRISLVFVPIVTHGFGGHQMAIHTDPNETCDNESTPGRSNAGCMFTNDSPATFAHEFGHLIGANDEYHLPATAAEIPQSIRDQMSPEDIRLSTVQGIENRVLPPQAGGRGIPDSLMNDQEASQHVYARHVQRLVNAINAQLPPGVPPYLIRRI